MVDPVLHGDQVDYPGESLSLVNGQLYGDGIGIKTFLQHLHCFFEVASCSIHLVHKDDPGNTISVRLSPHRLRLGFHPSHSA